MIAPAPPAMVMPVQRPRPFVPVLREGDAVPDLPLRDQLRQTFSFGATAGRITIVSFIYATCGDPKLCPLIAAKFAYLQHHIDPHAIRLATVTLDPRNDTPAVLRAYGARYGADPARWSLVTGEAGRVDEIVARFGIVAGRVRPGVIGHSEAAILVDARGRIAQIVDGAAWNPDDLLAAADTLTARGGDPWRRFGLWLGGRASALCGGRGAPPITVAAALMVIAVSAAAVLLVFRRAFRFPARPG